MCLQYLICPCDEFCKIIHCGVAVFFSILFVVDSIAHFDFFVLFVPESTLLFQLCKFGSALYPISEKTTLPVLSALASFVFDNRLTSYACCRFSSFMCWFDAQHLLLLCGSVLICNAMGQSCVGLMCTYVGPCSFGMQCVSLGQSLLVFFCNLF